ncbi:MAG: phosphonate metabolism transcriptional regulator PhnF [Rhodobacteraceae bacterium]|nr:phosphonate metabolism transcriptional regulator PhnF [Paracoccaceae bacterium]
MTKQVKIDRGTGVSVWRQISEWLRAEIASGAFVAGERLPTETDIAERFSVNRHTVRRAIAALTADGILRADQGRGTFVASTPINYPIRKRTRFSEIISSQDRTPSGRTIGSGQDEADALLALRLDVPPGTQLLRIETLRVVDGAPVLVATSWFEAERFRDAVGVYEATHSFTEVLKSGGVHDYERKESRISAELVEPQDALHLGIASGQPVLVVESVNVDQDGRPVQYTSTRMVAERMQLVIES